MSITDENVLNVPTLEPQKKHPTIFLRFDELQPTETLTIINDHDPKPLYYHLMSERGNIFDWEYVENGPQQWIVRITKKDLNQQEETVGEIVAKDFNKIAVFKKYGIDFCCNGKRTLTEACAKKGLNVEAVKSELQTSTAIAQHALPYNEWNLGFLADYIVNTYHAYVVKTLETLVPIALKVATKHADSNANLPEINFLVQQLDAEMRSHQMKEERVLFPYVKELTEAQQSSSVAHAAHFGTVKNPVNMMEMEHEHAGEIMAKLRVLTNNYTPPAEACNSYKALYGLLEEFETKLHEHIHLENNVLFPRAIELEKTLLN